MREGLFAGEDLKALQDALDRLEERESGAFRDTGKRSWGRIPRHLMDKDPVFLDLLKFSPVLSSGAGNDGSAGQASGIERADQLSG